MKTAIYRHVRRVTAASASLLLCALLPSGCTTGAGPGGSSASASASSIEKILAGPYYYEYTEDDTIYLVGRPASAVEFEENKTVEHSETMAGAGPRGQDVVVETDPQDPTLKSFLWKAFKARHLVYSEQVDGETILVLGDKASVEAYLQGTKPAKTKKLKIKGPAGETVLVEVDSDNPHLAKRLQAEFEARHPTVKEPKAAPAE